jgi:hypothetical protein
MWSSTCFRRQTAHHQDPKTALAAVSVQQLHVQQPTMYVKPKAASAVLGSDDGRCVARNMLSFT